MSYKSRRAPEIPLSSSGILKTLFFPLCAIYFAVKSNYMLLTDKSLILCKLMSTTCIVKTSLFLSVSHSENPTIRGFVHDTNPGMHAVHLEWCHWTGIVILQWAWHETLDAVQKLIIVEHYPIKQHQLPLQISGCLCAPLQHCTPLLAAG